MTSSPPVSPDLLDGPTRLLAGPGAGKTQALVDLYTALVEGGRAGRGEILVLTFSTAAAGEIAQRLDERLCDSYDEAWISTFHSFCARLLRDHRPDPGRLLMSGFQEWVAMRGTLPEVDASGLGSLARVARTDGFAQDALAFVALLKQNRVHHRQLSLLAMTSGTPRLQALAAVYSAYQERLDGAGLRDFRDLIADAIALLEALPDVLERYRAKFRYVLVDEFQDVDPAQFYLLRILAPPGRPGAEAPRLLVAGDPDQSIYGFRGTVPRLLAEDFGRVYGGREVALDVSHRCPPSVLDVGARLLAFTQPRRAVGRRFESDRAEREPESAVRVAREATAVDEAFYVAREIRRAMLEDRSLRPGDFAVLLRSTATLSAPFEEAIRALDLPYEVRGVGALARNEVVRFLLTYLRAVHEPNEPESLERLLASGLSGVGPRAAGRLRRHAIEQGRAFTKVVHRLLYWLDATDHAAWPLPWGDEAPAQPPADGDAPEAEPAVPAEATPPADPGPDFAAYLTPDELQAIHRAITAFTAVSRKAGRLSIAALAYTVLMEAGVMERVLHLPLPDAERQEALAELRAALGAFEELEEVWRRLHDEPPLLADIASRLDSLIARAVDDAEPAAGGRDAVQVMTVHQAKGLQFEVVFLSGFAQGLFPLAARPHPLLDEEDQHWLERNLPGFRPSWPSNPEEHAAEEARLAYVGITRPRRRLYLTYADEYDGAAGPSPFLEPLPGLPATELTRSEARLDAGSVLTLAEAETLLAGLPLADAERDRLEALGVDLAFVADPDAGRPFEPYARRPEDVDPGHFSPTSLNDYLKCPRLYWYNHHPGLASPPRGVEMERGSFLHRVLEDFHRRESEWRHLPAELQREWLEAALQGHLETYLNRVDSVLDRRAEEQEVRRILENYIRFATSFQPIRRLGTLMVERKFTLTLDGAEVRGKIDRVNDTGEGTCEVVDYKTGRGRTAQHAYDDYFGPELADVQLLMYYLACREGVDEEGRPIGLQPRFLSLWYPKDTVFGGMRQVLFPLGSPAPGVREWMQRAVGSEDLERGRATAIEAIRRIRAGDFAPAPRATIGTCLSWFGCPHAQICPYGGQPAE
ncbi:MAG TPA: ATP-dependent DNA helicase [Candidatus Dormibacteraeota bacterium]|nr:ATP-dependent DNA helicase [Candidatus Dormibacteraeota bacterium]